MTTQKKLLNESKLSTLCEQKIHFDVVDQWEFMHSNYNVHKETEKINMYERHGIACIGVDGEIHECLPWNNECWCGMKVAKKSVNDFDYENRFSCYECDQ